MLNCMAVRPRKRHCAGDCGAGARRGDPRGDGSAAFGLFSCCKDGMAASKRRRRKTENVLQTGNSVWVRLTAGWFTS